MYNGSCELGLVPLGTQCPVIRYEVNQAQSHVHVSADHNLQVQHAVDEAIIAVKGGSNDGAALLDISHQVGNSKTQGFI